MKKMLSESLLPCLLSLQEVVLLLLQFYEDEVDNKLEIVKNIISHKLGLSGDKMYARKLKVVKIDKTE